MADVVGAGILAMPLAGCRAFHQALNIYIFPIAVTFPYEPQWYGKSEGFGIGDFHRIWDLRLWRTSGLVPGSIALKSQMRKNAQDCPSSVNRVPFSLWHSLIFLTNSRHESTFFRIDEKYRHVHFVQLQETSAYHLANSRPLVSCWLC